MGGRKVCVDSGIACPFFNEGKIAGVGFVLEKMIADTAIFPARFSDQAHQKKFNLFNLVRSSGYPREDFNGRICQGSPLMRIVQKHHGQNMATSPAPNSTNIFYTHTFRQFMPR